MHANHVDWMIPFITTIVGRFVWKSSGRCQVLSVRACTFITHLIGMRQHPSPQLHQPLLDLLP